MAHPLSLAGCWRLIRSKGVVKKRICRYGFPRPKSRIYELNIGNPEVTRKLGIYHKSYLLPRSTDEVYINDYNPALLLAAKGNVDVQFVATMNTTLRDYATGYVSKRAEKGANEDLSSK